jgi:hypothetical protein
LIEHEFLSENALELARLQIRAVKSVDEIAAEIEWQFWLDWSIF